MTVPQPRTGFAEAAPLELAPALVRRHDPARPAVLAALAALVTVAAVLAMTAGAYPIPASTVLHLLIFGSSGVDPAMAAVFYEVRLPRVLLGLAVGATLGLTGAALQGLFRNPLADPGLIGVSNGAALGGAIFIVLGGSAAAALGGLGLPIAAFIGAMAAALLLHGFSRTDGVTSIVLMLLTGILINAATGAGLGLLSYLSDDMQLRQLTFWMLGSLAAAGWSAMGPAAVLMAVAVTGLLTQARALNAFALGETEAQHLGIATAQVKHAIVALAALGIGAAVALTGVIGFVGLVAPHAVRLAFGPDHRLVLPASALAGALLVTLADSAARTLIIPAELPVGLLCALIGTPVFGWLLWRSARSGGLA